MAGLLESLGLGLRNAGAVFSPDVYQAQNQEQRIMQQLQEQRKTLMAQQLIKAGESGAMPPDQVQQGLTQLGFQGLPVGPDAATQERIHRTRLDEAYRSAVDRLPPDAPLEMQAQLAARFGKPELAVQYQNALENRKVREQQVTAQIQATRDKLAQELQIAQQRGADAKEIAQMRIDAEDRIQRMLIEGRKDIARITASLKEPPAPQIVQSDTGTFQVDRAGNARPVLDPTTQQPIKPKAGPANHLTEGEAKGTLFYRQMRSANDEIAGLKFDPSKIQNQIGARMANSDFTNWAAPEQAQRYAQATEQWAEAYLRLKTGAATNSGEIKRNARTFFPQPGDSAAVVEQKNRMRRQAESDVAVVAGRGLQQTGQNAPSQSPGATGGWSIKEK